MQKKYMTQKNPNSKPRDTANKSKLKILAKVRTRTKERK